MENILENKAKFFAQYWGQEVSCVEIWDAPDRKGITVDLCDWRVTHEDSYLELTPLSDITDEDARRLSKIEFDFYTEDHVIRGHNIANWIDEQDYMSHCLPNFRKTNEAIDYLRSKGYALPWMGLSVEEQVEYGWVKLKNLNQ